MTVPVLKRILIVFAALGLLGLAVLLQQYLAFRSYIQTPLPIDEPYLLTIKPGAPTGSVIRELHQANVITHPLYFRLMVRLSGDARGIKAGEYRIQPGTTPRALLQRWVDGDVLQYQLTIIEGWNFRQLRQAMEAHPVLENTLAGLEDSALMAKIGHPEEHPEGRFLPDTYAFPRGTTDVDFLRRAYAAMSRTLDAAWAGRQEGLPLDSPYEALILASIIEKETGVPSEREEIAGVFVRRLQKGMRLQTDPTVIYGIGPDFDGDIRFRDLRRDTPYNTYTRHGLPPTPIALPGKASIEAALNPGDGSSLYFVSKGDGSHHFSDTYQEHTEAVRRYQLKK